jgi:hypothetical protein
MLLRWALSWHSRAKAFLRSGAGNHGLIPPSWAEKYFGPAKPGERSARYGMCGAEDLFPLTPYHRYRGMYRISKEERNPHLWAPRAAKQKVLCAPPQGRGNYCTEHCGTLAHVCVQAFATVVIVCLPVHRSVPSELSLGSKVSEAHLVKRLPILLVRVRDCLSVVCLPRKAMLC